MKLFNRYREAEKKTGALLKIDWSINDGGFLNMGKQNWTFCHSFSSKGSAMFGTQKSFRLRLQVALDNEPRYSWMTLELANLFEARWVYWIVKIWPEKNFRFVFNFGWTLTNESRKYLQNQLIEKERRTLKEMRKNVAASQHPGGGILHAR